MPKRCLTAILFLAVFLFIPIAFSQGASSPLKLKLQCYKKIVRPAVDQKAVHDAAKVALDALKKLQTKEAKGVSGEFWPEAINLMMTREFLEAHSEFQKALQTLLAIPGAKEILKAEILKLTPEGRGSNK